MDAMLKCPLCQRVVAAAFGAVDQGAATRARRLFLQHTEKNHGVGEIDGLLYLAEALRRRGSRA